MKKIIGLLVAAMVCVGAAFALNANSKDQDDNNVTLKQDSGSEVQQDKEEKSEADAEKSDKDTAEEAGNKDEEAASKDSNGEDKNADSKEVSSSVNSGNGNTTNSNTANNGSTAGTNDTNKDKPDSEPEKIETVTITINAQKAIDYGILNEAGFGHLPSNGVILNTTTVEFKEGDNVYDVLAKVVRDNKIHMEYTGAGSAIYIQGIDNLYEFDCGQYSGWMYEVNGVYPNYGVGAYTLKAGDKITFNYTCDLGKDLGATVN